MTGKSFVTATATRTTHQNTEITLFLPYIWRKDKPSAASAFEIRQRFKLTPPGEFGQREAGDKRIT